MLSIQTVSQKQSSQLSFFSRMVVIILFVSSGITIRSVLHFSSHSKFKSEYFISSPDDHTNTFIQHDDSQRYFRNLNTSSRRRAMKLTTAENSQCDVHAITTDKCQYVHSYCKEQAGEGLINYLYMRYCSFSDETSLFYFLFLFLLLFHQM